VHVIPISSVDIRPEDVQSVVDVLRSGMLAQGPMVRELEMIFAAVTGTTEAVAVSNGTIALVLALEALDLQAGDEVITSPFTFAATVNAVLQAGATVRFADISPADFNIDAKSVEALVNGRTKVLMPVHLYGQAADMKALVPLAAAYALHIVEDAAQAVGSRFHGRACGGFGIGCFSLYGTKNVTSGEGGVITTNDPVKADLMRTLRNQGSKERYVYDMPGHNYRLTDLQAAVGVSQMRRLDEISERRRSNADHLLRALAGCPHIDLPHELEGRYHTWHQFTIVVQPDAPFTREELADRLAHRGVGTGFYYPKTLPSYDCYRTHPRIVLDETPVADALASRVISLPVHPKLSPQDLDDVVAAVRASVHA
jgi:perosamine synthetase